MRSGFVRFGCGLGIGGGEEGGGIELGSVDFERAFSVDLIRTSVLA